MLFIFTLHGHLHIFVSTICLGKEPIKHYENTSVYMKLFYWKVVPKISKVKIITLQNNVLSLC